MRGARCRESDEGFVTIWILGLCVMLLFLGGISLDLWRAFSDRRALAALVDAAAVAGASDVDEEHVHARAGAGDPIVRLDEDAARRRAEDYLAAGARRLRIEEISITFSPDLSEITVAASATSDLTLVRILLPGADPLTVRVASTVQAQQSS
jgi:hypothetical protein